VGLSYPNRWSRLRRRTHVISRAARAPRKTRPAATEMLVIAPIERPFREVGDSGTCVTKVDGVEVVEPEVCAGMVKVVVKNEPVIEGDTDRVKWLGEGNGGGGKDIADLLTSRC